MQATWGEGKRSFARTTHIRMIQSSPLSDLGTIHLKQCSDVLVYLRFLYICGCVSCAYIRIWRHCTCIAKRDVLGVFSPEPVYLLGPHTEYVACPI